MAGPTAAATTWPPNTGSNSSPGRLELISTLPRPVPEHPAALKQMAHQSHLLHGLHRALQPCDTPWCSGPVPPGHTKTDTDC
jgi:hypothetical protein